MEYIKAIILGLVQGFTEFLPVSSSGHLVLVGHYLNFEQDISFEIFVHLGTLFAVILFFRKDLLKLIKAVIFFKNPDYKESRHMIAWLFIATFVTGVIGIVFKDSFFGMFSNPMFVAMMLSVTGLILFVSDMLDNIKKSNIFNKTKIFINMVYEITIYYGKKIIKLLPNNIQLLIMKILVFQKKIFNFTKYPLFVGFGQALAITPGISRSGTTIVLALLSGMNRTQATKFSFLLSIPAILGATLIDYRAATTIESSEYAVYLIGIITAFISGYFVIKLLIKLIAMAKLRYFSYYCWAVSIVAIISLLMTNG